MREISSRDNRIIREVASLRERKYRDEKRLFIAEGPNLVREAVYGSPGIRFIFMSAGAESPEIRGLAAEAEKKVPAVYEVSSDCFARISQTDSPQGIIAVIEKPEISEDAFFDAAGGGCILVLDRIQDPGNAGTLLRTAEAAGFKGAIAIKGTTDLFGPKAVRAAAGSLLRIPVLGVRDADSLLSTLEKHGKTAVAAAMEAETAIYDIDLRKNIALIIGNEGNGVSDELMSRARTVSIPMEGRVESLNAALSGAIIMYESLRQRTLGAKN